MIFSFDIYEHVDLQIWDDVERMLPDDYVMPDRAFLGTLEPDPNAASSFIGKQSLLPASWDGEAEWLSAALAKLPERYAIPDMAVLKRLFEVK